MRRRMAILSSIAALLASTAIAAPPVVNGYRLVTGRPDTLMPSAAFANLDAGDLVGGRRAGTTTATTCSSATGQPCISMGGQQFAIEVPLGEALDS